MKAVEGQVRRGMPSEVIIASGSSMPVVEAQAVELQSPVMATTSTCDSVAGGLAAIPVNAGRAVKATRPLLSPAQTAAAADASGLERLRT